MQLFELLDRGGTFVLLIARLRVASLGLLGTFDAIGVFKSQQVVPVDVVVVLVERSRVRVEVSNRPIVVRIRFVVVLWSGWVGLCGRMRICGSSGW